MPEVKDLDNFFGNRNNWEIRTKRGYLHSKDYYDNLDKRKRMYHLAGCDKPINNNEMILSYRINQLVYGKCDKIIVSDLRFKTLFNGFKGLRIL